MKPISDSPPSYKETMHFYMNKTEESCVVLVAKFK